MKGIPFQTEGFGFRSGSGNFVILEQGRLMRKCDADYLEPFRFTGSCIFGGSVDGNWLRLRAVFFEGWIIDLGIESFSPN